MQRTVPLSRHLLAQVPRQPCGPVPQLMQSSYMHKRTQLLLIFAALLVVQTAAHSVGLKLDLQRVVLACDAVVVGRVVATEEFDHNVTGRWSTLEVDQILFGIPASKSVRIRWGNNVADVPGVSVNAFADVGTPVKIDEHHFRNGVWYLRSCNGELMINGDGPMWIDTMGAEEIENSIVSMLAKPLPIVASPIWDETLQARKKLFAVHNYFSGLQLIHRAGSITNKH